VDLTVRFSRLELRRLFGNLAPGRQFIEVGIEGDLVDGGEFAGSIALDVVSQRGSGDVIVTPNPARGAAVLTFHTSAPARATLRLFDVRGRLVRVALDAPIYEPGYHDVPVTGGAGTGPLSAGIYFYRLETSEGTTMGRLVNLR
jgi:hypothetical protein